MMSSDSFYPEINIDFVLPFRAAISAMLNDPLWLEREECPYDGETREALRKLFLDLRAKPDLLRGKPVEMGAATGDKWADLEVELVNLFAELRTYSNGIGAEDGKEQMAYFRTATSLLDKITGLAERAHNVKLVSQFTSRVVGIFDDVLSPEQRTRAMERLEAV